MPTRSDSRARGTAAAAAVRRGRPAMAHPATGEPDYDDEEREFLMAIEAFKRATGRKFPTWTEALGVLKSLGYHR